MIERVEARRGTYHDSVRLMQVSREATAVAGVSDALVAMATDLNLRLFDELGFSMPTELGPDDLMIAVRADSEATVARALEAIEQAFEGVRTGHGDGAEIPLHLIESAASAVGADLALISVPGNHAFVEAMAALRAGLHVMVFSNNVGIEEEMLLKAEATRRGLLVMGPDCGTAIVGGVGLGFANVVLPGPVGIVGASGTGIQQLCCLLGEAGVGVRHALGTGSRDLSSRVGGISTQAALAALDDAPGVDVIVVVSKPPDPLVAEAISEAAAAARRPVVLAMLGEGGTTIEVAAREVLRILGRADCDFPSWPALQPTQPRASGLRGLFSGGSLRDEAALVLAGLPRPIAHELIDLGADEFTQGRPHPMIDLRVRIDEIERATASSDVGCLLLDVVLGHGAHPDPADELAPAIRIASDAGVGVVVTLVGTVDDPQGRDGQIATLREAGASVWLSNAAATREAAHQLGGAE